MSNLLRSLSTNEQIERIARFFERIAHFSLSLTKNEQFAQKNSNKLYFVCFLHFFVSFLKKGLVAKCFLIFLVAAKISVSD